MNILKSKKALSPVVASIILIAVTVAVSIAVAAWMGALTFTFTKTEELKITHVYFPLTSRFQIYVTNTGVATLTISKVYVDNVDHTADITYCSFDTSAPYDLTKGTSGYFNVTFGWVSGVKYTFAILTAQGNKYEYATTAVP
jgi:flagellin-like protein